MSLVSSTLAVGGVMGLVATGLVTQGEGSYRDAFWIGLAVSPRQPRPRGRRCSPGGPRPPPAASTGGVPHCSAPVPSCSCCRVPGNAWGWTALPTIGCAVGAVVVLAGWVVLQRRLREPLVRPSMLTDPHPRPEHAGLMTGLGLFVSFIAVLQYVQTPPEVAGYGFGASVLEAAVIYLLPGGLIGIVLAPIAGRVVTRVGALPTLLAGGLAGLAGFLLLAVLPRRALAGVVVGGLLTQVCGDRRLRGAADTRRPGGAAQRDRGRQRRQLDRPVGGAGRRQRAGRGAADRRH